MYIDPLEQAFRDAAQKYAIDGELEFDDDAKVSFGDDPGAYVQCWRWITDADVRDNNNAVKGHKCMWCLTEFPNLETSKECPNEECRSNRIDDQ